MTEKLLTRPENTLSDDPQLSPGVLAKPDLARQAELQETRDQLKHRVSQELIQYLKEMDIQTDIDAAGQRLDRVQMIIAENDSPFMAENEVPFSAAQYRPNSNRLIVPAENIGEASPETAGLDAYHAAVHEMIHAMAGHNFRTESESGQPGEVPANLEWFDEAMTEAITLDVLHRAAESEGKTSSAGNEHYRLQRELLGEIIRVSGLPMQDFIEAYLEQSDAPAENDDGRPAWQKLQDELATVFGPDFLQRITELHLNNPTLLLENGDDSEMPRYGRFAVEKMRDEWQNPTKKTALGGLKRLLKSGGRRAQQSTKTGKRAA
jgi:hypothetical protein